MSKAAEDAYAIAVSIHADNAPQGAPRGGTPVEHLDYLALLHELRSEIDVLISGAVSTCRLEGASWTEVGLQMRMTKQAAQQRFRP